MKKIALLFSIFSIAFFSCSNTKEYADNDLNKRNLKGKINAVQESNYEFTVSASGEYLKNKATLGESWNSYVEFNKDGFVTLKKVLDAYGHVVNTYIYEYDYDNLLQKETKYIATSNLDKIFVYEYDKNSRNVSVLKAYTPWETLDYYDEFSYKNNLLTKQETFDNEGNLAYYYTFKYDKNGNMTTEKWHTPNNGINKKEFTYNDKNQLIEKIETNESKSKTTWKFACDEHGNVIEEISIFADGSTIKRNIEYTYDSKKNWISKSVFENGEPLFLTERSITYK